MASELAGLGEPLLIVHGGGSYGHYWSVRYDMHSKPAAYDLHGLATVKNSMVKLNGIVLDALLEGGLDPYPIAPTALVSSGEAVPAAAQEAREIAESGLVPVTYGDAVWSGGAPPTYSQGIGSWGFWRASSGRASPSSSWSRRPVQRHRVRLLIEVAGGQDYTAREAGMDVTGGMRRKVQEAESMASDGLDVAFVNGTVQGRITDAVKRKNSGERSFRAGRDDRGAYSGRRGRQPVGTGEKVACHMPRGRLHRAFTALLFDGNGRLVLARRSASKMLWPGAWDGTFASHPRESETYVSSAERRMPEEMGASCPMDYLFKFEYHVPYRDVGSENEVCGTLIGVVEPSRFRVSSEEISEISRISPEGLRERIAEDPASYCPWMLIALYLLPESEPATMQKHSGIIASWTQPGLREELAMAIRAHLDDGSWRLVG